MWDRNVTTFWRAPRDDERKSSMTTTSSLSKPEGEVIRSCKCVECGQKATCPSLVRKMSIPRSLPLIFSVPQSSLGLLYALLPHLRLPPLRPPLPTRLRAALSQVLNRSII
jgi:hypothetical protein